MLEFLTFFGRALWRIACDLYTGNWSVKDTAMVAILGLIAAVIAIVLTVAVKALGLFALLFVGGFLLLELLSKFLPRYPD